MQGIHPPIDLAGDYESVIGAIKRKQAFILNAEAARNITLTSLAGSIEKAEKLYEHLAQQYQQGETGLSEQYAKAKAFEGQIDEAFNQSGGKIFATLREAQSYAYQRATTALADGERFAGQVAAYRASPQINKRWLILTALENGLKNIRKYVVISDKNNYIIQEIDAVEKLIPELSKMLGYGEK